LHHPATAPSPIYTLSLHDALPISWRTLVGLIFLVLAATNAWAQATAQINGSVADSSGAVLPGVTVVAIQTDTGLRREAVTDDKGDRKSTRLNSSHQIISYAVFCLK